MRRIFSMAMAAALLAPPALAHEGGTDVKGTVKAITTERIDVQTAHGETSFALTPDTEFVKGRAPAKAADVQPGARVVVHGRSRKGRLEAVEVRVGSGKAPARSP